MLLFLRYYNLCAYACNGAVLLKSFLVIAMHTYEMFCILELIDMNIGYKLTYPIPVPLTT